MKSYQPRIQRFLERTPKRVIRGFTMVELMVVIAIIGILAAIGVPSYRSMIEQNAVWNAASEFQRSVSLARTEAIKRNAPVAVRMLSTCPDGAGSNTDWGCGVDVMVDFNGDGAQNAGTLFGQNLNDEVLYINRLESKVIATPSVASAFILFGPTGNLPGGFGQRTVNFCPKTMPNCACEHRRQATIETTGRVTMTRGCP